ncbi:MAG: adenine deaminase [Anaerolineales bacterium]|nr:adenine deaminase [Anaerolineales bacterium]
MKWESILSAARGDTPADLLLTNCQLVNVFTSEIYQADVAVLGEIIVGVGKGYQAKEVLDLDGRYLCPGLINAHVHIESSMVTPTEYARAVAPHGTTTVVSDPHEIANVCGLAGIRYMLDAGAYAPITIYANAPSCVPATHMSTSGAVLNARDLEQLLDDPRVPGLAEMMNFPGVIYAAPEVITKLEAFAGRPIDGHAPGLSGKHLNAYVAAGIGSDHECVTAEEALEKLRLGMRVLIREGTTAQNLAALLPAAMINPSAASLCCFCTDDRHPADLLDGGDIDYLVRSAIAGGLDPVTAIQMATFNTAAWFRLYDRGALAPGKRADMVIFSNPAFFQAEMVFAGGKLIARDGEMVINPEKIEVDDSAVRSRVRIGGDALDLTIPAGGTRMRVIGAINDQVFTTHLELEPTVLDNQAVADPSRDLLKMAVIERHKGSGNLGLGFVQGIGLKRGAIATTVCHDHHNLIVIGADDASMHTAVRAIREMGGGEAVVDGDKIIHALPLPIAGLMSDRPLEEVRQNQEAMLQAAASLGCSLHDPFMTMSFLALEVIPSLKLTDQGLVDVEKFKLVPLWTD